VKLAAAVTGALLLCAGRVAAQQPVLPLPSATDTARSGSTPWLLSYFPYLGGGAGGGPILMGRVRYFQPAPWQDRVTYRQDLIAEAGIGIRGTRLARLTASAPLLGPGWRGRASLEAIRNTRANFYGLGNSTEASDARVSADAFAYKVQHVSYTGDAELSRRITGPVWAVAGGGVSHDRFAALSGSSAFATTFGDRTSDTDVRGKLELVLDTRDTEWDPRRGILAEAGIERGSGGDGYTRYFGRVRGYYGLDPATVVAAQLGASDLHGAPPLAALLQAPLWEAPLKLYGGGHTNRGLPGNRFVGTGVLMGSAEVRRHLITFKNALSVGVIGFVDAGRVFQGERLRLTTEDLAVSGGGGLALRLFRNNTAVFNIASGPDGLQVGGSAGWSF